MSENILLFHHTGRTYLLGKSMTLILLLKKVSTIIHLANVHENSLKKCPQKLTPNVHKNSPRKCPLEFTHENSCSLEFTPNFHKNSPFLCIIILSLPKNSIVDRYGI